MGMGFKCLRLEPIPHPASPLKGEELQTQQIANAVPNTTDREL